MESSWVKGAVNICDSTGIVAILPIMCISSTKWQQRLSFMENEAYKDIMIWYKVILLSVLHLVVVYNTPMIHTVGMSDTWAARTSDIHQSGDTFASHPLTAAFH